MSYVSTKITLEEIMVRIEFGIKKKRFQYQDVARKKVLI